MAAEPSKIVLGDETILDISQDTVNSSNLLQGETAHGSDGNRVVGSLVVPDELNDLDDVNISSPTGGQALIYDPQNDKWANGTVSATNVEYSSGVSVKDKIDNVDLTSGGEINGNIFVIKKGTSSAIGETYISAGNNIAEGSNDNSRGRLRLYGNKAYYLEVIPSNDMTANRQILLPMPSDNSQTLALKSDAYKELVRLTPTTNETNSQLLLRFQTAMAEIGSNPKRMGIIRWTVDGNEKIFRCGRFTSNNYMAYSCLYPSGSAISVYNIWYGGSGSVSFYNMTQNADGFTRTNLGSNVAEGSISLISFAE